MSGRFGFGRRSPHDAPVEVDRTPQNIPMPVGGFAPVRRPRRANPVLRWWWRNAYRVIVGAGLAAALIGAVMAVTKPPPLVGLTGDRLVAGSATLLPAGADGVWGTAGQAVYLLRHNSDGSVVGAASGTLGGQHFTGSCKLISKLPTEIDETCTYDLGGQQLSSTDTLPVDGHNRWKRVYSDGRQTTIGVPDSAGVVPVPFPFGR